MSNFDDIYDEAVDIEDKAERLGYDVKVVARFDKALDLYRRALAVKPNNFDCLYNSARLRLEIGSHYKHPNESFLWLQESYNVFSIAANNAEDQLSRFDAIYNSIQALTTIAELHADIGNEAEAIQTYENATFLIKNLVVEQQQLGTVTNDVDLGDGASFSLPPYQIVQNIKLLIDALLKLHDLSDDVGYLTRAQVELNDAININNTVEEQFKEVDSLMLLQAKIHLGECTSSQPPSVDAAQVLVGEYRSVLELRSQKKDNECVEALCELAEVLVEVAKSGTSSWALLSEAQGLFKQALDLEVSLKTIGSVDPNSIANQIKILLAMSTVSVYRAELVGKSNANYQTLINNSQVYLKRGLEMTQPVHKPHPNWQVEDAKYEAIVRIIDERIKYHNESEESQRHLVDILRRNNVNVDVYRRRQ
ncbi:hypothetical protein E3Q16_03487 [Wallemia mellicola]|nr:hypothetical protein E3Q16_03487 [Wallemia mellicola]